MCGQKHPALDTPKMHVGNPVMDFLLHLFPFIREMPQVHVKNRKTTTWFSLERDFKEQLRNLSSSSASLPTPKATKFRFSRRQSFLGLDVFQKWHFFLNVLFQTAIVIRSKWQTQYIFDLSSKWFGTWQQLPEALKMNISCLTCCGFGSFWSADLCVSGIWTGTTWLSSPSPTCLDSDISECCESELHAQRHHQETSTF